MSSVDYRLALAFKTDEFNEFIQNGYALTLTDLKSLQGEDVSVQKFKIDLLVIDLEEYDSKHLLDGSLKYEDCILTYSDEKATVDLETYNRLKPSLIIQKSNLTPQIILQKLHALDQHKQRLTTAQLATELQDKDQQLKIKLQQQLLSEQQELISRRQKILESNNKTEALRKILFSISEETDITRIETSLNELLTQSTSATWIKIIPHHLDHNFETDLKSQFSNHYEKHLCANCHIYFIKGDSKSFRTADREMFQKVSDALNLNLLKSETLKIQQQLEKIVSTAFNATASPLLIVDRDYNIIESNKAFHKHTSQNKKCFETLFGRKSPCEGCQFGQNFNLQIHSKNELHYYSVQSQKLTDFEEKNNHWVHFYTDYTEEKMLEQRLTQNAKMKELGLISSSIAHELNNPLGGIISYLQILQMELPKDQPLQKDLTEMLKAADRMKLIIENLLIFSRKSNPHTTQKVVLKHTLDNLIIINDLQFKIENIKVVQLIDEQNSPTVFISESAFRDSIHLIFNFFIESLRRIRLFKQNFTGLIEVKTTQDQINYYLEIQANIGPLNSEQKTKNIYFLVIHKSLIDQGFQVELTEPNSSWVLFKIAIPKTGPNDDFLIHPKS
ncbi:MAG: histidine kinase dimerization/phospho-acceptor domain-containing protein [Pseudobdellovibrio sp.]